VAGRLGRDETVRCFVNLFMMEATVDRGIDDVLEQVGEARTDELDETFATLYRQRYRDVYRYALLMLRRVEDAEDVSAEAFHRAFAAWQAGHGPEGQALPWLLLITRRLLSWLPLGSLNPAREPFQEADTRRTEFWLWFERFARELSQRQREVLILRYQRDLDDDQIGEILGISTSAVRSLVARACAALRRNPEIWQ
jgi:DNA-directed RNA polymerase specialized sigma24 family protein